MKSAGHYIAGKWTQSKAGEPLQAIDSIYGLKIWQGQAMTEAELKLATAEAKTAYHAWAALDINERLKKITLLIKELSKNHTELSNVMAQESGRPIWLLKESLNGLIYHLSSLAISSGRCPKGTIAICSSAISLNYIAQTFEVLLYGNSVILFSLPGCYASLEKLMQFWEKLGLPKGLLQLLHGKTENAINLAKMPEIDGLIFEGDVTTAAMMRLESAQLLNKYLLTQTCSLNPLIIKSVSNIEAAAYQTIRSAYLNSGQEAYAAKRLIIAADAEGDQILEAMMDMARSLRIAAYDASPEPFMSSMVSAYEAQTALNIQTQLQKQGAETRLPMKLILGGTGLLSAGIVELPAKMESLITSGPLLQVIRAQSNDECIRLANQTASFAAGMITEDLSFMNHYAACCRARQLYQNMPMQNPGRFQPLDYPSTQILTGILQFSQPLPGVKINSNQTLPL